MKGLAKELIQQAKPAFPSTAAQYAFLGTVLQTLSGPSQKHLGASFANTRTQFDILHWLIASREATVFHVFVMFTLAVAWACSSIAHAPVKTSLLTSAEYAAEGERETSQKLTGELQPVLFSADNIFLELRESIQRDQSILDRVESDEMESFLAGGSHVSASECPIS